MATAAEQKLITKTRQAILWATHRELVQDLIYSGVGRELIPEELASVLWVKVQELDSDFLPILKQAVSAAEEL